MGGLFELMAHKFVLSAIIFDYLGVVSEVGVGACSCAVVATLPPKATATE